MMRKQKQCSSDPMLIKQKEDPFTLKLMNAGPYCICYLIIMKFMLKKSFPSYKLNKQRSAILP